MKHGDSNALYDLELADETRVPLGTSADLMNPRVLDLHDRQQRLRNGAELLRSVVGDRDLCRVRDGRLDLARNIPLAWKAARCRASARAGERGGVGLGLRYGQPKLPRGPHRKLTPSRENEVDDPTRAITEPEAESGALPMIQTAPIALFDMTGWCSA